MSHYYSMEENHQEMQLLSYSTPLHAGAPSSSLHPQPWPSDSPFRDHFDGPSLDLQLSISVTPLLKPIRQVNKYKDNNINHHVKINNTSSPRVEVLKWQAAEQIRMAAMEKAYAERVREMTRREMELAQSEFARAHALRERAREEVERAEKMKKRATQKIDNSCMEITCQCCRHKFTP